MIFISCGTQEHQFKRMFDYLRSNQPDAEVVAQYGHTKTDEFSKLDFAFSPDFNKYLEQADLIITHGGVGTIMQALNLNKKVIAVARLEKFAEHVDDHQLEIVTKLTREGYILSANNQTDFDRCMDEIKTFSPRKYETNNASFNQSLNDLLEELL